MTAFLSLVAVAVFVTAQDPPKQADAKAEMKKMEGTWTIEKSVANGEEGIPEEELKKARLVVEGDKRIIKVDGETVVESSYTLNVTTKPKQMTIKVISGGSLEGKELKGIYELEGDTLKIAVGLDGMIPKTFESKEGSNVLLQVFKRAKEEKKKKSD